MAIASLSDLKGYIGVNDSSRDTELQIFLDAAEETVKAFLGYDPAETTYTDEHHYGAGYPWIYTDARPVTSVSSFTVNESDWDVNELVVRDVWIDTRGYVVPEGYDVKISYTAGYSTMPARIRLAVIKLAALHDRQHGPTGSLGIDSRSDSGGSSVSYGGETEEEILDGINDYRRYMSAYTSRQVPRWTYG